MPKINVYLPDDLAEAVRDIDLPVSAICQRALEHAVRRVTAMREVTRGTLAQTPDHGWFTRRCLGMVESAVATARDAGRPGAGTEHLLAAIAADESGMALRVLNALEITGQQVRSALADRADAPPGTTPGTMPGSAPEAGPASRSPFGPYAAAAMQLAAAESAGFGHEYVGSEHVLLGLIGEPDGVAGGVLRSLGAELRVTRRMVTAALAGWAARAQHVTLAAGPPPDQGAAAGRTQDPDAALAARIADAVRSGLTPVLSRIERLEQVTADYAITPKA